MLQGLRPHSKTSFEKNALYLASDHHNVQQMFHSERRRFSNTLHDEINDHRLTSVDEKAKSGAKHNVHELNENPGPPWTNYTLVDIAGSSNVADSRLTKLSTVDSTDGGVSQIPG